MTPDTSKDGWETIELLVLVKAYPSISIKHGEAVCVAGLRVDSPSPRWVRLFPVGFRDLPAEQQFRKYDVVQVRVQKHGSDLRAESYRPDLSSIRVGQHLSPGKHWPSRRQWVEPMLGLTMCGLDRGRRSGGDGPSLGVVRPRRVIDMAVRDSEPWSPSQLNTLHQGSLLAVKSELERPTHSFVYRWQCEEPGCRGHEQTVVDWELGQAYRSWRGRGRDVVEAVRQKWLSELCAEHRDTLFFVGDQHQRPGSFMVLGVFYPERRPNADQLTLPLAA